MPMHPVGRFASVATLLVVFLTSLLLGRQINASPGGQGINADLAGVPQITYVRLERTSLDYLYAAYCTNVADSYALDWGQINPDGSTAWSNHQDNPALNGCLQGILFFSGVGDGEHLFIVITARGGGGTTVSRFDLYPTPTHKLDQCSVQTDGLSPLIRDPRYRWDTAAGISCAFVDPNAVGVPPTVTTTPSPTATIAPPPTATTPPPPTATTTPSPTPVPPADALVVPYVDQVYVQQQPEYGYWNHCGPASVAMVLAATGKETRDVFTNRQATLDLVPLVKPTGYGGSNWRLMLNVLRSRGLGVTSFAPDFTTIRTSILAGKPVIAAINPPDHFIVITGAAADGTLTINDPFGGKFWWKSADNSLRNSTARNRNAPASKGKGVTYAYGDLALVLTASVGGSAPVAPAVALSVGASGGALNTQRVQVTFPGQTTAQIQAAEAISVTLTTQFSPAKPVPTATIALEAFQLDGVDATGQSMTQYTHEFTVNVDLDQDLVNHWGTVGGVISETVAVSSTASTASVQDLAKALTLAAWDPTLGQWVVLPTTVDLANYRLSAPTNRFTAFAVLVQQPRVVYLPFLFR